VCCYSQCRKKKLQGILGQEWEVPSSFRYSPTIGKFRWNVDAVMRFFQLRQPVKCHGNITHVLLVEQEQELFLIGIPYI